MCAVGLMPPGVGRMPGGRALRVCGIAHVPAAGCGWWWYLSTRSCCRVRLVVVLEGTPACDDACDPHACDAIDRDARADQSYDRGRLGCCGLTFWGFPGVQMAAPASGEGAPAQGSSGRPYFCRILERRMEPSSHRCA